MLLRAFHHTFKLNAYLYGMQYTYRLRCRRLLAVERSKRVSASGRARAGGKAVGPSETPGLAPLRRAPSQVDAADASAFPAAAARLG